MPLELYQFGPSPPCRMVRLLAEYLGVEIDIKDVDLSKGEHLEPEFIQINPQHTIPTLVDDGIVLTESRAILMYLVNKYGESDEALYPTDPDKRVLVDMRLCFDLGTLYVRFSDVYFSVLYNKTSLDPAKLEKLEDALGHVENFLKEGFIAGSGLTIADFSMSVILSTIQACGFDMSKYPEISTYLETCAGIMKGWEELNLVGANIFGQWVKAALAEADA